MLRFELLSQNVIGIAPQMADAIAHRAEMIMLKEPETYMDLVSGGPYFQLRK